MASMSGCEFRIFWEGDLNLGCLSLSYGSLVCVHISLVACCARRLIHANPANLPSLHKVGNRPWQGALKSRQSAQTSLPNAYSKNFMSFLTKGHYPFGVILENFCNLNGQTT